MAQTQRWMGIVTLAVALWAAPTAFAQRTAAAPSELQQAIAKLQDGGRADVPIALETLGALGDARGVEPIIARVRRGLPTTLTLTAMDTLVGIGSADAAPLLFELLSHRRPEIRLKAVSCIVSLNPTGADRALARVLSDSHERVRAAAATGLGEIKGRGALTELFLALDRGILEASSTLGQIVAPSEVPRLLGYVGRLPFGTLTVAFEKILERRDLNDRVKLEVVTRVAELATRDVRAFFERLDGAWPAAAGPTVKRAVRDAIARIAE